MSEQVPALLAPLEASASSARDWLVLLKPRVVSLVVFTGMVGMLVAPGYLHPVLGTVAILCIAVGAGASGVINMWYDRDIDAIMRRTANRPIPGGRIPRARRWRSASSWRSGRWWCWDWRPSRRGRDPGAVDRLLRVRLHHLAEAPDDAEHRHRRRRRGVPPLIGWAAVTGDIATLPVLLFLIVFLWTPPHFWSLSLYAHGDYKRAGVPMLPVIKGFRRTRQEVAAYTVILVAASLAPWALGLAGAIYGLSAAAMGAGYLAASWRVLRDRQDADGRSLTKDAPARAAFRYSLIYLAVVFAAMAVDRLAG